MKKERQMGLLKKRVLAISGEINAELVSDLNIAIIELNDKSKTVPIIISITTPGGDIDCGLGIYDTLKVSQAPIYTVAVGQVMSMGVPIFCAGAKRYSLEHTYFLIHPSTLSVIDSTTADLEDNVKYMKEQNVILDKIIADNSKLSLTKIDQFNKHQTFFSAKFALEYGIVNQPLLNKKEFWRLFK